MTNTTETVRGLRALADLLEANPDLYHPFVDYGGREFLIGAGKPELRQGQRVRVSYEATYESAGLGDSAHAHYVNVGVPVQAGVPAHATIEPIEDLRAGDVILTAAGFTVYCLHLGSEGFYTPQKDAPKHWWNAPDLPRPLTLLVRDGKAVQ